MGPMGPLSPCLPDSQNPYLGLAHPVPPELDPHGEGGVGPTNVGRGEWIAHLRVAGSCP